MAPWSSRPSGTASEEGPPAHAERFDGTLGANKTGGAAVEGGAGGLGLFGRPTRGTQAPRVEGGIGAGRSRRTVLELFIGPPIDPARGRFSGDGLPFTLALGPAAGQHPPRGGALESRSGVPQ